MEGIQSLNGSWPWPWPWIRPYGIPSCITRRPLPTYQISFKSKKLFVDRRTDVRTFFPSNIIRSTFGSRPKKPVNKPCAAGDRVIYFRRPWSQKQDDVQARPRHSAVEAQTCWTHALWSRKHFKLLLTSCRRAAATICPRPGLQRKQPSRAWSANMRHPAGRPHKPPADRMYATDVRQNHRLMPPGQRHNKLICPLYAVWGYLSSMIWHY